MNFKRSEIEEFNLPFTLHRPTTYIHIHYWKINKLTVDEIDRFNIVKPEVRCKLFQSKYLLFHLRMHTINKDNLISTTDNIPFHKDTHIPRTGYPCYTDLCPIQLC